MLHSLRTTCVTFKSTNPSLIQQDIKASNSKKKARIAAGIDFAQPSVDIDMVIEALEKPRVGLFYS